MPETMPISPALYSTNASEEAENGLLHNGPMLLARRAQPFFQIFGRELDIFNRIRELCLPFPGSMVKTLLIKLWTFVFLRLQTSPCSSS